MQTSLSQASETWSSELGEFVSEAHVHLAAILQDYKPSLSLIYIPAAEQDGLSKPWAILDDTPQQGQHIIRYMTHAEMQRPDEILAWVFEGDIARHGAESVFAGMELKENARKLLELKRQEEESYDRQQLFEFAAKTPLHSFRHNGTTFRS